MYNILIGGAAGQGIDTMVAILEKVLKQSGYNVFTTRDFMSRIRGGHNFILIRFSTDIIQSHDNEVDLIVGLNKETIEIHKDRLKSDGFILCDNSIISEDVRTIKINIEAMAKELGNIRVSGSIAIGVILKLFGENLENVNEVLKSFVKSKDLEVNIKAVAAGYEKVENQFKHLDGEFKDWMIISGSKALALGAIAAGLRFYSAYPMSPSTPIMEYLSEKGDIAGIIVEQAEDEIAAINMAIGASYAGARSMTGTSGGGFSLMVEGLGLAGIAEIPLVVVNVQRPGPATGLPTRTEQSDLKFVISASQGEFPRMVIAIRNHQDAFYQTIRAFELAEKYQMPIIILSDQYLGDSSATIKPFIVKDIKNNFSDNEHNSNDVYLRYKITSNGISPRLIPGKTINLVSADSDEHDEKGYITESAEVRKLMVDKRMKKIHLLKEELQEPEFIGEELFENLLIGWGSTYGPIKEAIQILNSIGKIKYAALMFGDVYPLPQKLLIEKAEKTKRIINIEQNATGQLASLIREQTGIICSESILKYDGRQISAKEIVDFFLKEEQK